MGKQITKKPAELLAEDQLPAGMKVGFTGFDGKKYYSVAKLSGQLMFQHLPELPKPKDPLYKKKVEAWKEAALKVADECGVVVYNVVYKKGKAVYAEIKEPGEYVLAKAAAEAVEQAKKKKEVKILKETPGPKEI